jgi:hypothetical protein
MHIVLTVVLIKNKNKKGSPNPKWCSINNGITLCLICAGQHRNFGVNISYIRSLTIDSW